MRINLLLRSLQKSSRKEFEYHYHTAMQSFIYSLLNESPFEKVKSIHNTTDKLPPFCFSDIRGPFGSHGELVENPEVCTEPKKDRYQIIVSTPIKEVGMTLLMQLNSRVQENPILNLKMSQFQIENVSLPSIYVRPGDAFFSDTPIIRKSSERSGGKTKHILFGNRKVIEKNCVEDSELFLNALENNLLWKLRELGTNATPITNNLEISCVGKHPKTIVPIFEMPSGKPYFVIGSRIRVKIRTDCPAASLAALNLLLDAGFGAHSSYGMGFMFKEGS